MAKGRIAAVAEADLVVEAVFEDEAVKRALWAELDRLAPGRAIFTSNKARTKVEGCVEIGRREGELVCGGRAATGAGLDAGPSSSRRSSPTCRRWRGLPRKRSSGRSSR